MEGSLACTPCRERTKIEALFRHHKDLDFDTGLPVELP